MVNWLYARPHLTNRDSGHNISGFHPRFSQIFCDQVSAHAEPDADDVGGGEAPDHVLDHGGVVGRVPVHEDTGARHRDCRQRPDVVDDTNPVPIELGVVHNSPNK